MIEERLNDVKTVRIISGVDFFVGASDYDKDYLIACHMSVCDV